MAVSVVNKTTGTDVDGNSTAATASVTPGSNKLSLLTVSSRTAISTDPNQPTATGNGLTWVVVNSIVWDTTSSSRKRITVLRAMGASPSAGAVSIDFAAQNQTDVVWSVDEFDGIDTSGTNGSGAIVQSATNKDESITAAILTVTLAAFSDGNNASFGGFCSDVAGTVSAAGTGFTLSGTAGGNNPLGTEFRIDNDTTVDLTFSGNGMMGGIAIELKAAAVVVASRFLTTHSRYW